MNRKIAIAMPIPGHPDTADVPLCVQEKLREIHHSQFQLLDDPGQKVERKIYSNVDTSKARDRLASIFLNETDCTDLLWWDSDVYPDDLQIIARMMGTGFPCVAATYPKKKFPAEMVYMKEGLSKGRHKVEVINDCVEVDGIGFGFVLTTRSCLQRMWDSYKPTRWYFDVVANQRRPSVGMFDLLYTEEMVLPNGERHRVKLSEDFSWCKSYQAIGGRVMMYVGQGAPLQHVGKHRFTGDSFEYFREVVDEVA